MELQEILTPNAIIRSKRKSIALVIKNNGEFIVRAPINCKEKEIFKFIEQKKDWIIAKKTDREENHIETLKVVNDEKIFILGKEYKIKTSHVKSAKIIDDIIIIPAINSKERLILFLKRYAKQYFSLRADTIGQLFDFQYSKITISSAKTCWGSCSYNNTLHFTYKLILCPEDVVDYIILHELCHTKIKNHSAKFWSLVKSCCPNYKLHEKWLKKNRGIVELI